MSDQGVELVDASELDLAHDAAVDEEPAPLDDEAMLVLDSGPDGPA